VTIAIIWVHFVADFIFQTRKMANNKSKHIGYLLYHCVEYTAFLLPFGLKYAAINGLMHLATDFVTSKMTSYFYANKKEKLFFVTIGLDQAIHMTCLISTIHMANPLWMN
jgi:hypothetical protein